MSLKVETRIFNCPRIKVGGYNTFGTGPSRSHRNCTCPAANFQEVAANKTSHVLHVNLDIQGAWTLSVLPRTNGGRWFTVNISPHEVAFSTRKSIENTRGIRKRSPLLRASWQQDRASNTH